MRAEFRQAGELLRYRKLHVMAGDAFVVGRGFVENGRAMRKIRGGHHHAARTLAIRRTGLIVGGVGRLESRNRFDGDRRFRQQRKKFGQLRLHLGDIAAVIVQNLVGGGGNVFRIIFQRRAECSQIGETLFFGDDRHLGLNAIDFAQADLVNFVRGHMRGGPAVDVVLVALLAVGQGSNGQRGAALRRVVGAHEIGELAVGRQHVGIDRVGDFLGQTLLIFSGNVGGIFLGGQQKRIGVDDALALHRNFFQQEAHRHQLVFHASAQDFGGLIQHARNLVQARDVILVMLHRIERDRERQIGQVGVDAVHLIDRHFEFFQIVIGVAQFEHAHQQIVGELILFGHAGGGDRGKLG